MAATISGSGTSTLVDLTTSGNTTLGDATTDTLTVGVTGIVKDASGNVGIGTASPSGKLNVISGSVAQLIIGFSATSASYLDSDLIVFRNAASAERCRIDSSGNLIVGDTTTGSRLKVKSTGTTNSTISFQVFDSGGTNEFYIQDGGNINTGLKASSPYNQTTGSAANMFVDSNGNLNRSTSSLKYKSDVNDALHGLADVLKLRSVTYKGKNDGDIIFGGFIAEEVDAAGLNEFVQYAADGSPDALAYGNMVSLCVKAIQEQQALITQLQADVAALKGTP